MRNVRAGCGCFWTGCGGSGWGCGRRTGWALGEGEEGSSEAVGFLSGGGGLGVARGVMEGEGGA